MMAPIVIFEGCDGTGKTTAVELVKQIALENYQLDKVVVLKRGQPTAEPILDQYMKDLKDNADADLILCDRWHWGEMIYGPLYRGESLLTPSAWQALDHWLAEQHALLILFDADEQVIVNRLKSRGDDFIKIEHVGDILEKYREIYNSQLEIYRRIIRFDEGDQFFEQYHAYEVLLQVL